MPRLADDKDASGAHEEAVRNLGIDFPAELAGVDAKPFDADLVWNRMNKGLILGAAAAALGDDWARKHGALKKKDLADAAAEAFRHDPARDAEADAAAVRWLPPGFVAVDVDAADVAEPVEVPADDSAETVPETDASGADAEPPTGDASTEATAAATPSDAPATDEPTATDGNGALPAFLTS